MALLHDRVYDIQAGKLEEVADNILYRSVRGGNCTLKHVHFISFVTHEVAVVGRFFNLNNLLNNTNHHYASINGGHPAWEILQTLLINVFGISKENTEHKEFVRTK